MLLACLGTTGAGIHGALEFDDTSLFVTAGYGDEKVHGSFRFLNSGDEKVTIAEIKTSCGCTTATLDKKIYAPGESGVIEAFLTIGQREGKESKKIEVFTDDTSQPVQILVLNTDIPKILEIRPRLLYWSAGIEPKPKIITVTVLYPDPLNIVGVHVSNPSFKATVKPIEAGRIYEVSVDPGAAAASQRGVVYVQTDLSPKPKRQFYAHLRVQ